MRSRPRVKVLLSPPFAMPGGEIEAEIVLTSKSETPVDYVSLELRGMVRVVLGSGKFRVKHEEDLLVQAWRSEPLTLQPGERRFRVRFVLPPDAPPSYGSASATVAYTLHLRVSIPWWPDRVHAFVMNVRPRPIEAPAPQPRVFATSTEGPIGTEPFVEMALDDTWLSPGGMVVGSVSFQNLGGRRVKRVTLAIVEYEIYSAPHFATNDARWWRFTLCNGAPAPGEPMPFSLRIPKEANTEVATRTFSMNTFLEARAEVAWGRDVVLRAPVFVAPAGSPERRRGIRLSPVGRERRLLVFQDVAESVGFELDPDSERLRGMRHGSAITIWTEQRADGPRIVAELRYGTLDLGLTIRERRWRDVLSANRVASGDQRTDERLVAHAREHAQAKPVVASLVPWLLGFDEVRLDDDDASLTSKGAAHTIDKLARFVERVIVLAAAIERARALIVPPAAFANDVDAWKIAAERLAGRLDLGSMSIRDGRIGTDAVELGTVFSDEGIVLGTRAAVTIDPPLDEVPRSFDDPSISAAARESFRELSSRVRRVRLERDVIELEIEGRSPDPNVHVPALELAARLRRTLGGTGSAGPFR